MISRDMLEDYIYDSLLLNGYAVDVKTLRLISGLCVYFLGMVQDDIDLVLFYDFIVGSLTLNGVEASDREVNMIVGLANLYVTE